MVGRSNDSKQTIFYGWPCVSHESSYYFVRYSGFSVNLLGIVINAVELNTDNFSLFCT